MKKRKPAENTPRVIAVAVAFFVILFAAIPEGELMLLSGFAIAFAILAYAVDPQIRAALSLRRRSAQNLMRDLR